MSGEVFINYRRDDDASFAGRIYDRLLAAFRKESVFFDVSSIGPGVDFSDEIEDRISHCDVLIAIIGRNWIDNPSDPTKSRIHNPEDWVRREIEAAFRNGTYVIPVLSHDSTFPEEEVIPKSIKGLARRNFRKISHEHFHESVDLLIADIKKIISKIKTDRSNAPVTNPKINVIPILGGITAGKTSLLVALRQSLFVGEGYTSAAGVMLVEEIESPLNRSRENSKVATEITTRSLAVLHDEALDGAQIAFSATFDSVYAYPLFIRYRSGFVGGFTHQEVALLDYAGGAMLPNHIRPSAGERERMRVRQRTFRRATGLVFCIDCSSEEWDSRDLEELAEFVAMTGKGLQRLAIAFTKLDTLISSGGQKTSVDSMNRAAIRRMITYSLNPAKKAYLKRVGALTHSASSAEVKCFATSTFGFIRPSGLVNYDQAEQRMHTLDENRWVPFMVADPIIYAAIGDVSNHRFGFSIEELCP